MTSCPKEYAGFDSIGSGGGGEFREASKKDLPRGEQAKCRAGLDAEGVLSGESAESPKGESSKEAIAIANAMSQPGYGESPSRGLGISQYLSSATPLETAGIRRTIAARSRIGERRDR